MRSTCLALVFIVASFTSSVLQAQVPNLMSYQGRVAVGGVNFSGSGSFKFALVNAAGTTTYWSNDGTSAAGSQPTAAVALTVANGLYSVLLGDTTIANMAAVPATVFANADVRLRVWFNDGPHGFQQLSPDQRLAPTAYLADGSVTSAKLATGNLTIGGTINATAFQSSGAPLKLSTLDKQPLDLSVNGLRGLRIQPGYTDGLFTPNLIGGDAANTISAGSIGSVIGGGGYLAPNSITGGAINATIAGGTDNIASNSEAFIGGGTSNRASGVGSVVAGGNTNTASNNGATVGGGAFNTAGYLATVPGGLSNTASGNFSFAAGLQAKAVNAGAFVWADSSAIDFASTASDQFLIRAAGGVGIGKNNPATALDVNGTVRATAFQSSGAPLKLSTLDKQPLDLSVNGLRGLRIQPGYTDGLFTPNLIGGDAANTISAGSFGSVIGGGGSGEPNSITNNAANATIAGGKDNIASGDEDFIGGGAHNRASGAGSVVAGGNTNTASSFRATVGGGESNTASGFYSTVPSGLSNTASGSYSFAAGRQAKAVNAGAFVWADSSAIDFTSTASDQFLIRAAGGVGIGKNNPATALDVNGTVRATSFSGSGTGLTGVALLGSSNTFGGAINATAFQGSGAPLKLSTLDNQPLDLSVNGLRGLRLQPGYTSGLLTPNLIGGDAANTISAASYGSVIGGGGRNGQPNAITNNAISATIAGGVDNIASGTEDFIGGGARNRASDTGSVVAGGFTNTASNWQATVGGGENNTASGYSATVPGGYSNTASNDYSFAAGYRAKAINVGAFVWSDSQASDFSSTASDQFSVRAGGGVRLMTSGAGVKVDTDSIVLSGSAQRARFGVAANFDFNTGAGDATSGLLIEQGVNESSGIFLDGDTITMWSPGDNPGTGTRLFRILDTDSMPTGAASAERFAIDGTGRILAAGGATILSTVSIGGDTSIGGNASVAGSQTIAGGLRIDSNGQSAGTLPGSAGLVFGASDSGEGIVSKRTTGANQYALEFLTSYTPRLSIANNGRVGIGTRSPTRGQLEINGSVSYTFASTSVGFSGPLAVVVNNGGITQGTSLYASNVIIAGSAVVSESDQRIKQIAGRSDAARYLAVLLGIEVTDYTLRDVAAHGRHPEKKVIAQQVETVFPQAVSRTTNTVPDIYRMATTADGWVNLATDLKVGDRVKLIVGTEQSVHEVLEVRDGAFRTDLQPEGREIFVYGREVQDFRNVDYDAIAMLNVSATQQIKKEKDAEVKALQDENAALKQQLAEVKAKEEAREAREREREVRLAKLEQFMPAAPSVNVTTAALKKGE